MDIHVHSSLADVAARTPGGLEALEEVGLHRVPFGASVADACARVGLEPSEALAQLEAAIRRAKERGEVPVGELDAAELVLRIARDHHARSFQTAHLAVALSRRLGRSRTSPLLQTIAELVETLVVELHAHIEREERSVLQRVRAFVHHRPVKGARPGDLERGMQAMRLDHQAVAQLFEELRARADDYRAPAGASHLWRALYELLEELEADVRRAVWVEEALFFPLVRELERDSTP